MDHFSELNLLTISDSYALIMFWILFFSHWCSFWSYNNWSAQICDDGPAPNREQSKLKLNDVAPDQFLLTNTNKTRIEILGSEKKNQN